MEQKVIIFTRTSSGIGYMKQLTEGTMAGRQRWLWLLWSGRRRKHGRGVLSHKNGCQTARFHAQHSSDTMFRPDYDARKLTA